MGLSLKGIGKFLGIGPDYRMGGRRVSPVGRQVQSTGTLYNSDGSQQYTSLPTQGGGAGSGLNYRSPASRGVGFTPGSAETGYRTPTLAHETHPMMRPKGDKLSGIAQLIGAIGGTGADIYGSIREGMARDKEIASNREMATNELASREKMNANELSSREEIEAARLEEEKKRRQDAQFQMLMSAMGAGIR